MLNQQDKLAQRYVAHGKSSDSGIASEHFTDAHAIRTYKIHENYNKFRSLFKVTGGLTQSEGNFHTSHSQKITWTKRTQVASHIESA